MHRTHLRRQNLETLNDLEELKRVLANTNVPTQPGAVCTEQPLRSPDLSLETDSDPLEMTQTAAINIETSNKQVAYKPVKPKPVTKRQGLTTGAHGPNTGVPNGQQVLPSTSNTPRINPSPFVRNPLPPINSTSNDSVLSTDGAPSLISRGPPTDMSAQPLRGRSPPPSYFAQDFTQSIPSPAVSPIEPPPSYPQVRQRIMAEGHALTSN